MSGAKKSFDPKSLFSTQTIIIAGIVWSLLALMFFLLFSVSTPGERRPLWYTLGTYIFEMGAFLSAGVLCFRNWRSPQIVSGRNVWLGIGIGMFCYFLGQAVFGYYELVLGVEPELTPADIFFVLNYIAIGVGLVMAVISRQLSLELWQWGVVAVIGAAGALFAWLISAPAPATSPQALLMPPAIAETTLAQAPATSPKASPSPTAKPASPAASPKATNSPAAKPSPSPSAAKSPTPAAKESPKSSAQPTKSPAAADSAAKPEESLPVKILKLFYVIADVVLLILATTLLLAFWGGRSAQSWRMIAAASFSLYIADMWFKYATTQIKDYLSGGLLEVFWVFSGVLFAIGAALEYDLSTRSRSSARRRRA